MLALCSQNDENSPEGLEQNVVGLFHVFKDTSLDVQEFDQGLWGGRVGGAREQKWDRKADIATQRRAMAGFDQRGLWAAVLPTTQYSPALSPEFNFISFSLNFLSK